MKTRSMVVDLRSFGALKTDQGFDLQRWEGAQKHVVRVHFGTPSNAEWIASMALEWLEQRRLETERAFVGVGDTLRRARGGQ